MVSSRCITGLVYASALTFLLLILKLFASVNYIDEYNEDHWNHRSSLFPEHSKHRAAKRRTGVDFKSLLKTNHEPPFCQKGLILLILVTSAPWHIEQRNAIRNTWAKKARRGDILLAGFIPRWPAIGDGHFFRHLARAQNIWRYSSWELRRLLQKFNP